MKTKTYRFDKTFGPTASFAGIIILAAGLYASVMSLFGVILVVIGAYLAFTNTSTTIDFENKRIRHTSNLFGIIRTGHWIDIEPDMKLGYIKKKKGYRTYSRSNRTLDIRIQTRTLFLLDELNKPIIPLKKSSKTKGNDDKTNIAQALGLNEI